MNLMHIVRFSDVKIIKRKEGRKEGKVGANQTKFEVFHAERA